ncbi:hypothetical protein LAZ67_2006615 [Cordylochernes scorpioides]|uniref:Uncharacterized protein n=1 Tax=Cordylochernes scorpioides TaxID=51811 RepID=A0ABY6K6B8_9ARAC|nr:hypothetical protein LAZ67_2006615 [Cordylochernes scorpioides]
MPGHRKRRQFKQTDAFTRGMVIGLKRAGWSIRQIAADTHLGASTVHRLWRRWLEQGNVAIYRNAGATRVTSARVDRRILRQAVAAPQATCTAILQHVQDTLDHSISTRTISRRLVANGLHSCRPLRRLPLTPPNRRQRLEWCRARSTWMTEWHRVVFSDESRFCLSSDSRRVRVWRRRGERSNPAAIVERPIVRQRGIMVWGAIAYDSRSPLLRIQGTMTVQRYVDDVLRPVTLPYLQGVPNALYQQDNARPHTARISQQALQDVQMLPWPPYSPDLSPIEHVWDIIGRRLHALPQPRSEDELWQMVEREWRAIPQDAIRTLNDSLPRRVAACIAVRDNTPPPPTPNPREQIVFRAHDLPKHLPITPAFCTDQMYRSSFISHSTSLPLPPYSPDLPLDFTPLPSTFRLPQLEFETVSSTPTVVRRYFNARIVEHWPVEALESSMPSDRGIKSCETCLLGNYWLPCLLEPTSRTLRMMVWESLNPCWSGHHPYLRRLMLDKPRAELPVDWGTKQCIYILLGCQPISMLSLGERIDIRLTKIETRMDDWDMRFCNIEEKLTKCIESQQATEKLASCNSLKPNLVFYGIEREGDENQADCNLKIQNIIRDKMEIGDDLKITKCHRLSRGSNAPVLVVVPDYAYRAKIFKNAYKLRDTKISISKDNSKNVREQRRILIAKRKELGERGIKSKLRDNKLFVNDKLPLTSERRAKDHIISSLSDKLLDFLEDNSLTIVNGRSRGDKDGDFTYISERGSSTIDYCILSQGSLQILLDFKFDDQLYSDHHPLVLTIKGQNFNEKKTNGKIIILRDIDANFGSNVICKITYSIKGGPRKSKPWFDKDCYDMKKLAKESLGKYRKINRLEDRKSYASSRKKYLALLDLKRKGFDNEKQEILRNAKDSKTFWKTIALYKSTCIIQGEIAIQDWLNFYRELMTTEKNLRICNLHNVISQNDPILDTEITNADIYKEIAGLKSNKACGPDGIPNEVLKILPDSYILLLKQLYNSVMTTGKYPAIWTNSTIHPIYKNGYKNSPSNYREFGDIHLFLYADDIAIIGESRMNLQKKIKILKEYLDENLMTLNESKSKIMVFRNGEHKDLLDSIQDIFIRGFLNLPRYTPGYIIRLETGRISLSVTALKLTLKYWLRVLNMSSDRLPRRCFNRTRELSNASGTPIGFIKKLTNLLNNNGSSALVYCDDPETLRSAITGLLKTAADQSIQNDLTRMDKSKLYSHYKDIHISFMTEGYLLGDFPFPVVRLLAQVRILSSFFRENHTKMLCGEDPICTFCNSKLKNEITHYIFYCYALKEERKPLCSKLGNSVLHFHQ